MKHGIRHEVIEQKVRFMNDPRLKWMVVVSKVKAHEQFRNYSLEKLLGILKSHESEVTKETKVVSGMGSLAMVAKRNKVNEDDFESNLSDCELRNEDYSSEKVKEDKVNNFQKEEDKKEKKVAGDSRYDCNYCHGKNHLAKDCMLRRTNEKEEGEDDEAYHLRKLEEIKQKKKDDNVMPVLVVHENNDENECGGVEVWSTDSKDEEVRKPTHGKSLVAKREPHEDEIDANCFQCESIVSSDETSEAYKIRLDKTESYIKSKDHMDTLRQLHDENDKLKIKTENVQKFDSLKDEVDCSQFLQEENEKAKVLISENSVEFARISQNEPKTLKVKATVFPMVQTVPNQVFATGGLDKNKTFELTSLVNEKYKDGCAEFFWSAPIGNADETKGLSERTSWKVKGRYVAELLDNLLDFKKGSPSGTKEVQSETKPQSAKNKPHVKKAKPQVNIHKSAEQLAEQKRLRNQRYQNNLSERKNFWQSQNSNYLRREKSSNQSTKALSQLIHDDKFDTEWYIDSGCSCHMTGRNEELREYRELKDGGVVKFDNNALGEIKGYDMITNGKFSIRKVAYVEGLQHNLISVSELVVVTRLKVSFDDEGS
ncbi:uncharacterized protein LOC111890346 [Lactuca sativa]|uniref:uncharacterized protein LOC111890346 n=1 Tax=Lactuca sativa TaxID=4236 RepID=UPI0022AE7DB8|nr:uncharacterized protein LOC111890346 [Lactuca sativa]